MSIIRYIREHGKLPPNGRFCCYLGGGGDGGAGARAAASKAEQAAEDKRIRGNIELIDILFKNQLGAINPEIEKLQAELAGLGAAPTADQPGFSIFNRDPNAGRRGEINSRLGLLDEASGLLTGPSQKEREARVVSDVENFFFDDLREQKEISDREGKFELTRRGGIGGSQELDFIRETQRKQDDATLDIGTSAQSAVDDLRVQDSVLESNLISLANQDVDRNILTSDFVNDLGAGLSRASNTAQLTRFDPFFENAENLFKGVALQRGNTAGRKEADRLLSFFSANPTRSTGTVRR